MSHDVSVSTCARCMRKITCDANLSTLYPVGYSGSLSTVNETNCNKKKINYKNSYELISNSFQTCPTTMCLKRDAIDCIDLDG